MERKKRRQIKNLNSNKIYINEKYLQIMFKKIKVHEELLLHTKPILDSTRILQVDSSEGGGSTLHVECEEASNHEFYHDIKTKKCNIL